MKRHLGIVVLFSSSKIRISGSPVAQLLKNLSAIAGDTEARDWIPEWKNPLEKEMATSSSILMENSVDRGYN